jgi:parvulin-like peptidyl-prolyl isomerase
MVGVRVNTLTKEIMKKILHKAKRLIGKKSDVQKTSVPRITNETLAEHRERIIKQGKRYKYPVQYTKNRIVFVSVIILVVLVIAMTATTWFRLYKAQDTSAFFYRVTQLIPLPVAVVDGQPVEYDDYLREMRSALHYLQTNEQVSVSSDEGKQQVEYQRRVNLDKVIAQAYAQKLATQLGITVSDQEVNTPIQQLVDASKKQGGSQAVVEKSIKDFYDWSFDEYRASIKAQLLQKKVTQVIDEKGKAIIDQAHAALVSGVDFTTVAKQYSKDTGVEQSGGSFGIVNKTDIDTFGYNNVLFSLKKDTYSDVITGNDGFYIIKALSDDPSSRLVQRIYVPYTEFDARLKSLKDANKVSEYITVPKK